MDDLSGHLIGLAANGEVFHRSRGLAAIELVVWHLHLTHGVSLDSEARRLEFILEWSNYQEGNENEYKALF